MAIVAVVLCSPAHQDAFRCELRANRRRSFRASARSRLSCFIARWSSSPWSFRQLT